MIAALTDDNWFEQATKLFEKLDEKKEEEEDADDDSDWDNEL